MIELIGATKYYPTPLGPHYVFRDVSLRLPDDINIGVIGPNGAGKTTLLRLLAGVDVLSAGRIIRTGRVSWPMGLTAGLQRTLTGRENARFACRIYGMGPDDIRPQLDRIRDISGVGKFFDLPVSSYSAGMTQRVAFAISISLGFDYYIFDEISAGGDKAFAGMAQAMIQDRLKSSRFILASHNINEILKLCKAAILIRDGTLSYYDNAEEAVSAYTKPAASGGPGVQKARAAKVEKLRRQYISLKRFEIRQSAAAERIADPQRKAEHLRVIDANRNLLQQVILQFRMLGAPLPSDAAVSEAAPPETADAGLAQRIMAVRRQIDDLRAAEVRQELNAENATSKAKRADFLERLEATRQDLRERERELREAEAKARAAAKPSAPRRPVVPAPRAPRPGSITQIIAPAAPIRTGASQRPSLPAQGNNHK